jgi:hypothetical protein
MTPPLDLAALEALLAKATTPSEWYSSGIGNEAAVDFGERGDGWADVCGTNAEANARLIVAAVNALPALLAELRRLRGEVAGARREGMAVALREARNACEAIRATFTAEAAKALESGRDERAAEVNAWARGARVSRDAVSQLAADALAAAEGAGEVSR